MRKLIWLALLPLLMVACGSTSKIPYGQPGASVKIIDGELYFFFFRPDVDPITSAGRELSSNRRIAIEKYFQDHPEIAPPNCANGIELLGGGDTVNGYSSAKFRCK